LTHKLTTILRSKVRKYFLYTNSQNKLRSKIAMRQCILKKYFKIIPPLYIHTSYVVCKKLSNHPFSKCFCKNR